MRMLCAMAAAGVVVGSILPTGPLAAQAGPTMDHAMGGATDHSMFVVPLGSWSLVGMAQAFPVVTIGAPGGDEGDPVRATGWYLTQPALMTNLESPGQRVVLRTTLDFEGLTQEDGELTFGGWGEGFLDKRHPHTLLHEAMLSVNAWSVGGGGLSLSAGKGFAPYGTDDPMSRPGLKYPTNHHLSQILERWTVNGVWRTTGWSVEAGAFSGNEPEGAYDLSNVDGFGRSWSARLTRRFGGGMETDVDAWELSASYGRVVETHDGVREATRLVNGAVRREGAAGPGTLYALVEASHGRPDDGPELFSVLGEFAWASGRHRPYVRFEEARRPEYARLGPSTSDAYFTYDHDDGPIGTTRWSITTLAYAVDATRGSVSVRPFVEAQHHRVRADRGGVQPEALFGSGSFWALSLGARVFLGGGPMRMGRYGVLDAMTEMTRGAADGTMMHDEHGPAPYSGNASATSAGGSPPPPTATTTYCRPSCR